MSAINATITTSASRFALPVNVAVVGATGAVGQVVVELLAERSFPVGDLHLLASERSAGTSVAFGNRHVRVRQLDGFDFSQVAIAFFAAGSEIAARFAGLAAAAGCTVIDKSSHFRMHPEVCLVVPEVNGADLAMDQAGARGGRIIASPNCSTIQLVVALKPLHDAFGLVRINIATYQSVSGAGRGGVEALAGQTARLLNGQPSDDAVFPRQIAFNVIPQVETFGAGGYTTEELKIIHESRRVLGIPDLRVNPTCVRVPVFYGHSQAVHLETRDKAHAQAAREVLAAAPGVKVLDDPSSGSYPTAVSEGAGQDAVWVGRIREDMSHERGLNLWIVSDNIRKGAALNSVQIAEQLLTGLC